MSWRRLPVVPLLLVVLLGATACSGADKSDRVQVVAGAYPFAWLAEQVAGPDADVVSLAEPGAEPHDLELTARQVAAVKDADVVVHVEGFQAAVDDALEDGPQGLEVRRVVRSGGGRVSADPHLWLDPTAMQLLASGLAGRLSALDGAHRQGYTDRAASVVRGLGELDATFRASLTGCARKEVVTSHAAFGYLTSRYGLVQKGISGIDPEAEPSPATVASVARYAQEHGVTTVFFETLVDPKVARTVAAEIGARTAVLDPVESAKAPDDYLTVMRRNATALHDALGCR